MDRRRPVSPRRGKPCVRWEDQGAIRRWTKQPQLESHDTVYEGADGKDRIVPN